MSWLALLAEGVDLCFVLWRTVKPETLAPDSQASGQRLSISFSAAIFEGGFGLVWSGQCFAPSVIPAILEMEGRPGEAPCRAEHVVSAWCDGGQGGEVPAPAECCSPTIRCLPPYCHLTSGFVQRPLLSIIILL